MQTSQVMTYMQTQPNFDDSHMMWDISANLYQKCLILCSKILLKVLHNMSLKVLLPLQHTGFQISPILNAFVTNFSISFSYLQIVPCIHDPADINMLARVCGPVQHFLCWKSLTYWNQVGWNLKRVSCHGKRTFIARGVSCRTISLTSFNGVCCIELHLAKIALFIHLR